MLAVPCHPQVETLEAWPIVRVPSHAVVDWRAFYAGSAAQDVVRGIQAEIIAEPKLATAQAKMDVITAGAAKASAKTKSKSAAASAKAHASAATAKAETHAAVTGAAAEAKTHAAVTAADAEAKTHAVTTTAATAPTAHSGLGGYRNRQREGERRHGRQK
jgi:hypothetical protein